MTRTLAILLILFVIAAPAQAQRPAPFAEFSLPDVVITWYSPEPNQQQEFPYGRALIENITTGQTFFVTVWASDCDPVACTWRVNIAPEYGGRYRILEALLWLDAGNVWLPIDRQPDVHDWRQVYLPGVVR